MRANIKSMMPGEILLEDYVKPMGLTQNALASGGRKGLLILTQEVEALHDNYAMVNQASDVRAGCRIQVNDSVKVLLPAGKR
jgi:hypothetical protein